MSKTLLIVSGGIEAADAAKRAKEMGFTSSSPTAITQAPGFAHADSVPDRRRLWPTETAAAAERYQPQNPQDRRRDLRRRRRAR